MSTQTPDQATQRTLPATFKKVVVVAAHAVGWFWFLLAGVGGLILLIHEGPLPITNGWFAMFSGIAACPLVGPLLRKYRAVRVSAGVQFLVALLIMIAGRIAVVLVLHRPFLPHRGA